jgi:hypothetical protein
MNQLKNDSAPVESAGERELLIHCLRLAVARARLAVNTLETCGVALRHKTITSDKAMEWLRDEGLLSHIEIPGGPTA